MLCKRTSCLLILIDELQNGIYWCCEEALGAYERYLMQRESYRYHTQSRLTQEIPIGALDFL